MSEEINKVREFAAQNKMFSANEIGSDARSEAMQKAQKNANLFNKNPEEAFKADGKLSKAEQKILVEEFGMDAKVVKKLNKNNPEVVKFLDELIHAGDNVTTSTSDSIKKARQEVVAKYLVGDNLVLDENLNDEFEVMGFKKDAQIDLVRANNDAKLKEAGFDNSTIQGHSDTPTVKEGIKRRLTKDENGNNFVEIYSDDLAVADIENADSKKIMTLKQLDQNYYQNENGDYYKMDKDNVYKKFTPLNALTLKLSNSDKELRYDLDDNELTLFKANDFEGYEAMEILKKDGEFFIKETEDKRTFYKLEEKDDKMVMTMEKTEAIVPEPLEPEVPDFKDALTKFNRTVNVDETGSTQRYTKKEKWSTNINVVGNEYTEGGMPKKLSIMLPDEYGTDKATGKRFRTQMKLIDEENKVYQAGNGRKFQLSVSADGIQLKQIEIDNDATKASLNKNTLKLAEEAKKNGLDGNLKKVVIDTPEKADAVIKMLSNTNQAWEAYTTIGSNNGMGTSNGDTGAGGGIFEQLIDNPNNGITTFAQIKPAIEGLVNRIPPQLTNKLEYRMLKIAVRQLSSINGSLEYVAAVSNTNNNPVRQLDLALQFFAKNLAAGNIQGANDIRNVAIKLGNGKTEIVSAHHLDANTSNAVFKIYDNNTGSRERFVMTNGSQNVQFQNAFGTTPTNGPSFVSDITGNNRKGTVSIDPAKVNDFEGYYFESLDNPNKKYTLTVESDKVYINGASSKVLLEDVLNGKTQMPV